MTRSKTFLTALLTFALLLIAASCADTPKTAEVKKEAPKPPEPVSGQYAFFQMYGAARAWAQDLQAMQMQSISLKEVKSEAGKYPAWRVQFVSESRRAAKTYTYSVVTAEGLNKGIYGSAEESYSGPRGQNSPFMIQALKTDSTAAYETAMQHGKEYSKKHPDMHITILLENTKRFSNPAWRVIWGESAGTSNFSIYVDASTGEYLQTMR
jgi:hypothetical protein